MVGETDLDVLLGNLDLCVPPEKYVFCTTAKKQITGELLEGAFATVAEAEGLTLVLPKQAADALDLNYDSVFKCLTLRVHSSLYAVGLTAAIAGRLAEYGISANVIAGYYHDHVFVPEEQADEAVGALAEFER